MIAFLWLGFIFANWNIWGGWRRA